MVPENSVVNIDGISHRRCSMKKGALKHFAEFIGKHQCQSLFFNKKETLVQLFSFEFWEIFRNTYFTEHLRITASVRFWTSTSFKIMTCIAGGMDNKYIDVFLFFRVQCTNRLSFCCIYCSFCGDHYVSICSLPFI